MTYNRKNMILGATTAETRPAETERAVRLLIETLDKTIWADHPEACAWKNCLAALALAFDPDRRVYDVLEALPATQGRLDKTGLLNTMANLGSYGSSVRTTPEDVDGRLLPCLFTPANKKMPPYVILEKTVDSLMVFDGDDATVHKLLPSDPRLSQKGEMWLFQPFDANRQATSKFMRFGSGNTWFRALIGRFSDYFKQVILAGLALNIVALASPLYMMVVYDSVISPNDIGSLIPITIGVAIALATEFMLRSTRSKSLSWLSARLDNLVGNKIFSHLIGLPPDLIERASVAAQIARIKTFESVRDLFSGSIFLSFLEIPYVVLALVLIGFVAGPLVMVPMLMLTFYAVLFMWMRRQIKVVIRMAAKASSVRQQFTMETFDKLQGIHANGLGRIWAKKYEDVSGREIVMNFNLAWLGTVGETLAQALTMLSAVATVGYGAHLIWAGDITTGALIASMMLVWRVLTPFYSLCAMIPRLEQLKNSIHQVNDLMDLETEQETATSAARMPSIRGRITFTGASLRYSSENDAALNNINTDIEAGQIVAVTGRNGAGKTSLLKLAKGMYRPVSGSVRIDGFDIRQLDAVHLRRHIAYVPQRPEFFSGTIAENLKIARPLATMQEIEQALFLADAIDEVKKMEGGMNAKINPGKIPSGLAARLSLARAYLHGGSILLIDELPGSLMNSRAGEYLRRYLEKSKGKRTIIMVTHRDDMMALADSTIELRKGEQPLYSKQSASQQPPETFKENMKESA